MDELELIEDNKVVANLSITDVNQFIQGDDKDGVIVEDGNNNNIVGSISFAGKKPVASNSIRKPEKSSSIPLSSPANQYTGIPPTVETQPSADPVKVEHLIADTSTFDARSLYDFLTKVLPEVMEPLVDKAIAKHIMALDKRDRDIAASKNELFIDDSYEKDAKIVIGSGSFSYNFKYLERQIFDDFIILTLKSTDFSLSFTSSKEVALQFVDPTGKIKEVYEGVFISNPFRISQKLEYDTLIFLKSEKDEEEN